jgi:hypothetical protein
MIGEANLAAAIGKGAVADENGPPKAEGAQVYLVEAGLEDQDDVGGAGARLGRRSNPPWKRPAGSGQAYDTRAWIRK